MLTDVKVIAKRLMVKRGVSYKLVFLHWLGVSLIMSSGTIARALARQFDLSQLLVKKILIFLDDAYRRCYYTLR